MPEELRETAYWVLAALAGGRRHGYALIGEVAELSAGRVQLKVTTLYATLERLEAQGRVARDGEETVAGRQRRYYTLTAEGASALDDEAKRIEAAARATTSRLRAHGWTTEEARA